MAKRWRPPSKIKIGHATYDVVPQRNIFNDQNQKLLGNITYATRVLRYDDSPDIHPDQIKDVVLHEVLHGIWYNHSLGNNPNEEQVILAFEAGLRGLLKDNPKLIEMLR